MRRYRFRRRNILSPRARTVIFFVSALAIVFAFICLYGRMRGVIKDIASAEAADISLGMINEGIAASYLEAERNTDDMSDITYGDDGNVSAIILNSDAVNSKRTDIVRRILSAFSGGKLTAAIPLGAATGIDFLSQAGPMISVVLDSVPTVKADIREEFVTSGINQTVYRIMLDITADVKVLLPSSSFNVKTKNSVCLEETVIVGRVPDAYTEIHRAGNEITETDIDDIYDFGAVNG